MTARIPNGYYNAFAVPGAWELGETESTGTEYIQVTFRIEGGDFHGETIAWYGYFTDKTAERTIESLRHAGWQGNDICDIEALPNAVQLVIEAEEYNGTVRSKVQWVNSLRGPGVKNPLGDGKRRELAARMKGLAASKAVAPVDTTPPPVSNGAAHHMSQQNGGGQFEEDDIPF